MSAIMCPPAIDAGSPSSWPKPNAGIWPGCPWGLGVCGFLSFSFACFNETFNRFLPICEKHGALRLDHEECEGHIKAYLEPIKCLNGCLSGVGIIEANKPKTAASSSDLFHHDAGRDYVAIGTKQVVHVSIGEIIGNMENEQVSALGTLSILCGLNGGTRSNELGAVCSS